MLKLGCFTNYIKIKQPLEEKDIIHIIEFTFYLIHTIKRPQTEYEFKYKLIRQCFHNIAIVAEKEDNL